MKYNNLPAYSEPQAELCNIHSSEILCDSMVSGDIEGTDFVNWE